MRSKPLLRSFVSILLLLLPVGDGAKAAGGKETWDEVIPSPPTPEAQATYGYKDLDYLTSFEEPRIGLTAPLNAQTSIGLPGEIPVAYNYTMRVRYSDFLLCMEMETPEGEKRPYLMPNFRQSCPGGWYPGCISEWDYGSIHYKLTVLMVPNDPYPIDVYEIVVSNVGGKEATASLDVTLDCALSASVRGDLIADSGKPLIVMDPVVPAEDLYREAGCLNPRNIAAAPWHQGWAKAQPEYIHPWTTCRLGWYGTPIEYRLRCEQNEDLRVFLGFQSPSTTFCAEMQGTVEGDPTTQSTLTPFTPGSTQLDADRRVLRFEGRDEDGDGYIHITAQATTSFPQRALLSVIQAYSAGSGIQSEDVAMGRNLPEARYRINVGADAPTQIDMVTVGKDPTLHAIRLKYHPRLEPKQERKFLLKSCALGRPEPGFCSTVPRPFATGEDWKPMFEPRFPENKTPYGLDVPPGTDLTRYRLFGPYAPEDCQTQLEAVRRLTGEKAFEDVRRFWDQFAGRGALLSVPEEIINEVLKHQLAILSLHRIQWKPLKYCVGVDGPEFYWDHSPRSSCYEYLAWDWLGYPEMARPMLDTWLTPRSSLPPNRWNVGQWDDNDPAHEGMWQTRVNQWDAQGQTLWAITEHFLLYRDYQWLEDNYTAIAKGGEWIIRMIDRENQRLGSAEKPGCGLLFAEGPGEPPIGGGHSFYNNAFALLGLRRCALVASELKRKADAQRFEALAIDLAAHLDEAMHSAFARMNNFIGTLPVSVERETALAPPDPDTGGIRFQTGFCGSLIWPTEALSPRSRLADSLYRYREDEGRSTGGLLSWPYIFAEQGVGYIRRGEYDRCSDLFYAYVSNANGTYDWGECLSLYNTFPDYNPPRTGRMDHGESPHTWAAALFVEWLRHMLLHEEGNTLHIAPAIPRKWLAQPNPVSVRNAPTHFGRVTFSLTAGLDRTTIRGDVSLDPKRKPERLLVHVRGPGGRGLSSVTVNGRRWEAFTGDVVVIPEPGTRTVIEAEYKARL